MTVLLIILAVVAGLLLIFFVGGLVATARRQRLDRREYSEHLAAAEHALAEAWATDRGWDREQMEAVARAALAAERPGESFVKLDLVLVDDRPGVTEDRATFVASGDGGEARVVLLRGEQGWATERVE